MSFSHPSTPFPLGAHPVPGGTRFAVACAAADRVQLCLISDDGAERRVELTEPTYGVWHTVVAGVQVGQRYGYRVHGVHEPAAGLFCDPAKLLLDPAARRITGTLGDAEVLITRGADTLGHVPLSVVTAPPRPPAPSSPVRAEDTVVYEAHVGSVTANHPGVPPELRGTYLGLSHPVVLDHLVRLGVSVVELLPVHAFLTEASVRARGMDNHWGYSTAAFCAPHPGYASRPGAEQEEFQTLVDALHGVGIAVWCDVVYNHTCEGEPTDPTLGWRGYGGYYLPFGTDLTGCGNTLDSGSPTVVRMVLDSLRHFASMGVDGFRFDLASVLGRPRGAGFDPAAALLTAIAADPVLAGCTLVAEPWDVTGEGYQVGGFGVQWWEWNDRFRDTVRDFWRGAAGVRQLAHRLAGSGDLFAGRGRRPWAGINFVTAHDGFTVTDVVSYARKHNGANGEDGRDGTDDNRSVNHGVEGPTEDPGVRAARARHVRALLATLVLSAGTPMLLAGDELGHTQAGNNNAYCRPSDDQLAWSLDWAAADEELVAFVSRVLALRRSSPTLRGSTFYTGRPRNGHDGPADVAWYDGSGAELDDAGWHDETSRVLQMWVTAVDDKESWLLVVNGGPAHAVVLGGQPSTTLELVLDASTPTGEPVRTTMRNKGEVLRVPGHTVMVLRTGVGIRP